MTAGPAQSIGGLLLTFDDRQVRSWAAQRATFDRFGARATFFVSEPDLLDATERRLLRSLAADGHSIGAHGWRHRNAPDLLDAYGPEAYLTREVVPCLDELASIGAPARSFAYPNSRRDPASDVAVLTVVDRLRSGGRRTESIGAGTVGDSSVVPATEIGSRRLLIGRGIDTGRGSARHPDDLAVVADLIERAATLPGYLTLYAHEIATCGDGHHVAPDRLEALLRLACEHALAMIGFDDLPGVSP